jgi:hypothetical protein
MKTRRVTNAMIFDEAQRTLALETCTPAECPTACARHAASAQVMHTQNAYRRLRQRPDDSPLRRYRLSEQRSHEVGRLMWVASCVLRERNEKYPRCKESHAWEALPRGRVVCFECDAERPEPGQ